MSIKDILGVEVKDKKIQCKYYEIQTTRPVYRNAGLPHLGTVGYKPTSNIERLYEISKVVSQINEPTWKLINLLHKEPEDFSFTVQVANYASFECKEINFCIDNITSAGQMNLDNSRLESMTYKDKHISIFSLFTNLEIKLIKEHVTKISKDRRTLKTKQARQELDDFISEKLK